LSNEGIIIKLFERTITLRRILIILGGIWILYMGLDMLYHSCLPNRGGCVTTETRSPVILVVGLIWWISYIWLKDLFFDIYPLERFKFHKISNLQYINIDLIKKDDTEWINELRQQSTRK